MNDFTFESPSQAIAWADEVLSRSPVKTLLKEHVGGAVSAITFNEVTDIAQTISVICNNTDGPYLGKTCLCVYSPILNSARLDIVAEIIASEVSRKPGVTKSLQTLKRMAIGYLKEERRSRLFDKRIRVSSIASEIGISKQSFYKSMSWAEAGGHTRQIICDWSVAGEHAISAGLGEVGLIT